MATLSRTRIKPMLAKDESSYGSDPTLAGGTDDITLINSDDPVTPDFEEIPVRPHGPTFTHTTKSVIGKRKNGVNVNLLVQGPAVLPSGTTVPAVNGFTGMLSLMKACGNAVTSAASTTTTIKPAAISAITSTYVKIEEDGALWALPGVYGNMILTGGPGRPGVNANFIGVGKYSEVTKSTISGFVGPDRSEPFLSVTASITPSGGGAYNPADGLIVDNFSFNMGAVQVDVDDVTESTGLDRRLFTDRRPTLELTIAHDVANTTNLDIDEIYGDLTARIDHGIILAWGTTPNVFTLTIPTGQLLNIQPRSKNGYKILVLTYLVRHATAQSEWSLVIT